MSVVSVYVRTVMLIVRGRVVLPQHVDIPPRGRAVQYVMDVVTMEISMAMVNLSKTLVTPVRHVNAPVGTFIAAKIARKQLAHIPFEGRAAWCAVEIVFMETE